MHSFSESVHKLKNYLKTRECVFFNDVSVVLGCNLLLYLYKLFYLSAYDFFRYAHFLKNYA